MTDEHTERPYGLFLLGGLSILVALASVVAILMKSDDQPTTAATATTLAGKAVGSPIESVPTSAAVLMAPSEVLIVAGDPISLTGLVPDEATKAALGVAAQQAGGAAVDNQLEVDPAVGATEGLVTLSGSVLGKEGETDWLNGFELAMAGTGYTVVSQLETDSLPLQLALTEIFVEQPIGFDSKRSEIRLGDERDTLAQVAELLMTYPGPSIEVEGHTDNQGIPAENLSLSQQRADSVVNFLVGQGVPASRLDPQGYGSEKPIADNATAEGREANRRIVFTVRPA